MKILFFKKETDYYLRRSLSYTEIKHIDENKKYDNKLRNFLTIMLTIFCFIIFF